VILVSDPIRKVVNYLEIMKRATQNDVAHLAGVSRATVSYVINERSEGIIPITEETRRKVLSAAKQLGYEPDAAAQSLRLQVSHTIGVLIPDMFNPHYWQIISGVEETAQAKGYSLLLTSTSLKPNREHIAVRELLRRRVDGIILALTYANEDELEIKTIIHRRSPVVTLGNSINELDSVSADDQSGARGLIQHLIELGHRRVGFIYGVAHHQLGIHRLNVYHQMMAEMGQSDSDQYVEYCGAKISDGYQAAQRLLKRIPRPTAIMTINDHLAIGVMHAIFEHGLRVPEDISVTGFDDIVDASYVQPPLTTVKMNAEEMGSTAASVLFERIAEPERPIQHLMISTQLVCRASTGLAPRGD
jgi:LacI family transcriptional regulator